MAEHCFYETVTQAENRVLFGKRVTEFGQVRRILTEAYARLLAAKLYGARAVDYVRSASREDRRYLLYTPINKMQVTTEGERIVRLLAEVISAKGFERDSYFDERQEHHRRAAEARGHRPRQPRADRSSSCPTTCSATEALEAPPPRRDAADDAFLFAQGPTRGLSRITFPDWRPVFDALRGGAQRRAASASRPTRSSALIAGRTADARADDRRPRLPAVARPALHAASPTGS